jgi:hypothetical protein
MTWDRSSDPDPVGRIRLPDLFEPHNSVVGLFCALPCRAARRDTSHRYLSIAGTVLMSPPGIADTLRTDSAQNP